MLLSIIISISDIIEFLFKLLLLLLWHDDICELLLFWCCGCCGQLFVVDLALWFHLEVLVDLEDGLLLELSRVLSLLS